LSSRLRQDSTNADTLYDDNAGRVFKRGGSGAKTSGFFDCFRRSVAAPRGGHRRRLRRWLSRVHEFAGVVGRDERRGRPFDGGACSR
jgi:hypothetical protein